MAGLHTSSLQLLYLHDEELLLILHKTENSKVSVDWIDYRMQKLTVNCSSSLSLWKPFKNTSSFSLFLLNIASICGGFFGFATKTCNG